MRFFLENRIVKFHVKIHSGIYKEISSMLLTLPELDARLWLPVSVNVLDELEVIRKRNFSECILYSFYIIK